MKVKMRDWRVLLETADLGSRIRLIVDPWKYDESIALRVEKEIATCELPKNMATSMLIQPNIVLEERINNVKEWLKKISEKEPVAVRFQIGEDIYLIVDERHFFYSS